MKPGDWTTGFSAGTLHRKITVLVVVIKWNGYLRTVTYTFQRTDIKVQFSIFYVMPHLQREQFAKYLVLNLNVVTTKIFF